MDQLRKTTSVFPLGISEVVFYAENNPIRYTIYTIIPDIRVKVKPQTKQCKERVSF